MHSLMTIGLDISQPPWAELQFDTLLLAHMINEEWPRAKTLENCGQHYIKKGKVDPEKMKGFTKTFGWGAVPWRLMYDYACGDAEVTLELWEHLWPMFQKKFAGDAGRLWTDEIGFQNTLFRMEQRGIEVDLSFCKQYESIAEIEMQQIEDELGFTPSKTSALSKFLFEELKLPVLAYTPGGKPAMTKAVMEDYDRMLALPMFPSSARLVLDYRGWMKANSSFYRPFQTLVDSKGRVNCNYKQHGTVTGRLSCETPNLQQIPRSSDKAWNGRIKSAFRASPGYALVGFDYSQLELRLATAYGQELILLDEFSKPDADPFTRYASIIGADRYTTKTFFYAMIYGAGEEKIAKTLHRDMIDMHDQYVAFKQSIPGILKAASLANTKARQRGYVRLWTGRRRHFKKPEDSFKAFNSLLQGGGAEVVKRVMLDMDHNLTDDNCRMLLQVHDEVVFEIREDLVDVYSAKIVDTMEAMPTEFFGLPFKVAGKVWG
jgi:DNA polymerase-1